MPRGEPKNPKLPAAPEDDASPEKPKRTRELRAVPSAETPSDVEEMLAHMAAIEAERVADQKAGKKPKNDLDHQEIQRWAEDRLITDKAVELLRTREKDANGKQPSENDARQRLADDQDLAWDLRIAAVRKMMEETDNPQTRIGLSVTLDELLEARPLIDVTDDMIVDEEIHLKDSDLEEVSSIATQRFMDELRELEKSRKPEDDEQVIPITDDMLISETSENLAELQNIEKTRAEEEALVREAGGQRLHEQRDQLKKTVDELSKKEASLKVALGLSGKKTTKGKISDELERITAALNAAQKELATVEDLAVKKSESLSALIPKLVDVVSETEAKQKTEKAEAEKAREKKIVGDFVARRNTLQQAIEQGKAWSGPLQELRAFAASHEAGIGQEAAAEMAATVSAWEDALEEIAPILAHGFRRDDKVDEQVRKRMRKMTRGLSQAALNEMDSAHDMPTLVDARELRIKALEELLKKPGKLGAEYAQRLQELEEAKGMMMNLRAPGRPFRPRKDMAVDVPSYVEEKIVAMHPDMELGALRQGLRDDPATHRAMQIDALRALINEAKSEIAKDSFRSLLDRLQKANAQEIAKKGEPVRERINAEVEQDRKSIAAMISQLKAEAAAIGGGQFFNDEGDYLPWKAQETSDEAKELLGKYYHSVAEEVPVEMAAAKDARITLEKYLAALEQSKSYLEARRKAVADAIARDAKAGGADAQYLQRIAQQLNETLGLPPAKESARRPSRAEDPAAWDRAERARLLTESIEDGAKDLRKYAKMMREGSFFDRDTYIPEEIGKMQAQLEEWRQQLEETDPKAAASPEAAYDEALQDARDALALASAQQARALEAQLKSRAEMLAKKAEEASWDGDRERYSEEAEKFAQFASEASGDAAAMAQAETAQENARVLAAKESARKRASAAKEILLQEFGLSQDLLDREAAGQLKFSESVKLWWMRRNAKFVDAMQEYQSASETAASIARQQEAAAPSRKAAKDNSRIPNFISNPRRRETLDRGLKGGGIRGPLG